MIAKKGSKSTALNLNKSASAKATPAFPMAPLVGCLRNSSQKYIATSIPNAEATSVVTRWPCARKLGEKAKSESTSKAQSFPKIFLAQKKRKRSEERRVGKEC